MNTIAFRGTILVVLFMISSCAPIHIHTQYDPSVDFTPLKTFNWVPKPEDKNPAADLVPGFRQRVRNALESILLEKGLTKSQPDTTPDLHVAFYCHLATKPRSWVSNWGYPYHPWYATPWGYVHDPWVVWWRPVHVAVETVEVGTMVVDFIDVKSNRLIWRGWGSGVTDPDIPEEKLFQITREILKRFPLGNSIDYK